MKERGSERAEGEGEGEGEGCRREDSAERE